MLRGILIKPCSHSYPIANPLVSGIGVGDSDASATSALILTVLQDSMGRIATILFAHRLGTALEPECKMYRLAADIFNDAAMILDCLSPAFPRTSRVLLLSLSSILRALCGVAAGSSKASLSAHFATQGNLGELNAVSINKFNYECLLRAILERFEPRNSHISHGNACWHLCGITYTLSICDLVRDDCPPCHSSQYELYGRQSS